MISQFVSPYDQPLLKHLNFEFPPGTNAVGRLDFYSEGLLILTNDKSLTRRLLHPSKKHLRRYVVLVRGAVSDQTLNTLRTGVRIGVKGKGYATTQACDISIIAPPPLPEREPPYKQYGEHTWLEFNLSEGKNRQIRKMCKEVRHNVCRLVRTHIEDLHLHDLQSGEVKEIAQADLEKLLKLDPAN